MQRVVSRNVSQDCDHGNRQGTPLFERSARGPRAALRRQSHASDLGTCEAPPWAPAHGHTPRRGLVALRARAVGLRFAAVGRGGGKRIGVFPWLRGRTDSQSSRVRPARTSWTGLLVDPDFSPRSTLASAGCSTLALLTCKVLLCARLGLCLVMEERPSEPGAP